MNLEDLRKHYDETDTAAELEAAIEAGTARWETATAKDPLVGTSLRLPRSLIERLRAEAETRHMSMTTLVRGLLVEAMQRPADQGADDNAVLHALEGLRSEVRELRDAIGPAGSQGGAEASPRVVQEVDFTQSRSAARSKKLTGRSMKTGAAPTRSTADFWTTTAAKTGTLRGGKSAKVQKTAAQGKRDMVAKTTRATQDAAAKTQRAASKAAGTQAAKKTSQSKSGGSGPVRRGGTR